MVAVPAIRHQVSPHVRTEGKRTALRGQRFLHPTTLYGMFVPVVAVSERNQKAMREKRRTLVTPEMARVWLVNQPAGTHRQIRKSVVDAMVDDMKSGRWIEDIGGPIVLGSNGEILDWNHRLRAIAKSGVSIHADVIRDGTPDDLVVIDATPKRNLADTFTFLGYGNAHGRIMSAFVYAAGR